MADEHPEQDPLAKKTEEVHRLREFIQSTSFAGDEREVADELSGGTDQHPGDISDVTYQREWDLTVEKILDQEEELIEQAERRRQQGTYGICANCGRPIEKERLEARPEAIYCIDCQRKLEQGLL